MVDWPICFPMTRRTERGHFCPREPSFRNSLTRMSALLTFADPWPRCPCDPEHELTGETPVPLILP